MLQVGFEHVNPIYTYFVPELSKQALAKQTTHSICDNQPTKQSAFT